jgi:rRNA maturation RNase YbeY
VERVRDNAEKLGVSLKSELHRVLFHAVLHLCGYKDKNKKDMELMRKKEEELLSKYFGR